VLDFIKEAYQHVKPIAAIAEGMNLLPVASGEGIVVAQENEDSKLFGQAFIDAIAAHRHWSRTI
jgi:catalase